MVKIIIDQGHTNENRGGVLFNEGNQNFLFGNLLAKELENYEGIEVYKIRQNLMDYPDYRLRGRLYNYLNADLYFSTHTNAWNNPQTSGTEIFNSTDNKDEILATRILNNAIKILRTKNRGVKPSGKNDYHVLKTSNAKLKMLIEWVFHTNLEDSKKYLANQKELAESTAKIIAEYYGKELKRGETKVENKNSKNKFYRVFAGSYKDKNNANQLLNELKSKGFKDSFIAYEEVDIKPQRKSNEEIAREVLAGKWGNNPERKQKLEAAGYKYLDIQAIVNRISK